MSAHKYPPECPAFAVTQTGQSLRRGAIVEGMGIAENPQWIYLRIPDRSALSAEARKRWTDKALDDAIARQGESCLWCCVKLDQVRPLTPAAVDMLAGDA